MSEMTINKDQINKIICDSCKGEFSPKEIEFKQVDKQIDNQWLKILWYECPHCSCKYRVSIDNVETLMMIRDYREAIKRVKRHKEKGRKPTEQQIEKVLSLSKRIKSKQEKLNNKYDKSFTTLATINK